MWQAAVCMIMKGKLIFTRQFDQMDCGPACIRMVASAYGRDYPLSYLRTLSHLTREGVSVAGIRDALKVIGMESASFELPLEQLRTHCPLPAILHWEQNHFVVLYGVSKGRFSGKWKYRVANPAFGKQTLSEDDFAGHWLNGDKGIVVACEPTGDFYAKADVKERHSLLRFAHKFVWPYRWEMSQTALGMLFGIVLSLVTPFLTQAMVDEGISLRNMVVIGYYSMRILLVYLLFTATCTLWMMYFFRCRKALDYERFELNAHNQNKMYELMSGITDIKVNSFETYKLNEWHELQERLYRMSQKSLLLNQIQNAGYTLVGQLRNIIITFWIASEVVNGTLTLGMMMSISSIIGQINSPLSQLINFLQQYQDAKISLERSEEVQLCSPEDRLGMESLDVVVPQDIALDHVSFSYTGSIGEKALDDISFTIPAGKTTAIVGESGSGKTTLMKLLLKFYKPTAGHITIGGHDLENISASSVRAALGVVMQENYIFSDTLKGNIVLGNEPDDHRVDEALDAACLRQFVDDHPLGLQTKLGSDGMGVSGGEKQRIMIARAIYKRPAYIMLDEATSSLDAETERKITENLGSLRKGRTMLVIAHRLSTVKNADNIIVLRHGKVVELGNHQQLVAQRGYYYELVRNQLELEES